MMPSKKTALHAVDILLSPAKLVPQSCAVKEDVSIKFHGALNTLGHSPQARTLFSGAKRSSSSKVEKFAGVETRNVGDLV
jgi:hypothetical protein